MRQSAIYGRLHLRALENNVNVWRTITPMRHGSPPGSARKALTVTAQATNVVFLNVPDAHAEPLEEFLKQRGMLMQGVYAARLVTHLDVRVTTSMRSSQPSRITSREQRDDPAHRQLRQLYLQPAQ